MIELQDNPQLHCFTVEAMNTTFTLRLDVPDASLARDTASACINQLEELEAELSRFRPDSDVSRINGLAAGEPLYISERTHACLLEAGEAQVATAGLFDVTIGARTWPEGYSMATGESGLSGQLQVAPDRPLVTCLAPGRQIDLGGIGKGYALDELARTLVSYRVESALLSSGASTLLAVGPQTWPLALTGDAVTKEFGLQGCALSASGTGIQGAHVLHPDHLNEEPSYQFERVWLTAPSAALADAFSTACLLMDDDEVRAFTRARDGQVVVYVEKMGGQIVRAND